MYDAGGHTPRAAPKQEQPRPALYRRCVVAVALATLGLTLPADALGATVSSKDECDGCPYDVVTFTAARSEANRVSFRSGEEGIVVADAGARLRVRDGCRRLDEHSATCWYSADVPIKVNLGDEDDTLTTEIEVDARGGPGNDRLHGSTRLDGGAGNDVLEGGRSSDQLTGGPGRDHVRGNEGLDRLIDGETEDQAAVDVYDGGPNGDDYGTGDPMGDILDYTIRVKRVAIDFSGRASTIEDEFSGVESAIGGHGNDRLTGDEQANALSGGGGADVLRGGGAKDELGGGRGSDRLYGGDGDDRLFDGTGRDVLVAGPGADSLSARDPLDAKTSSEINDRLDCGEDLDTIGASGDGGVRVQPNCEQVSVVGGHLAPAPALTRDAAEFAGHCFVRRCRLRIVLATARRVEALGRRRVSWAAEALLRVPLEPHAVSTLRDGAWVRVQLSARWPDGPIQRIAYQAFVHR